MYIISGYNLKQGFKSTKIIDYINIMLVHLLHNDEDNLFVNEVFFFISQGHCINYWAFLI